MKKSGKNLQDIFGEIPQSKWNAEADYLTENQGWLRHARKVAIEVLECLDQKNISQKELAAELGISPQVVNKWLKGRENFTLETIAKLEKALGIDLLNINRPSLAGKKQEARNPVSFAEAYVVPQARKAPRAKTQAKQAKVIPLHEQKYSDFSIAQ